MASGQPFASICDGMEGDLSTISATRRSRPMIAVRKLFKVLAANESAAAEFDASQLADRKQILN